MELRHLRYFVAIAEELNFTRASARLHIAQPSLSQQIRQLEEEIGYSLLRRNRHRVELSDIGKIFLPEAIRTLAQADFSIRLARKRGEGKSGRLAFAFISTPIPFLPRLITHYNRSHPDVDLDLVEMPAIHQVEALHDGIVDVGVIAPFQNDERLEQIPIFHDPVVLALPRSNPLAKRTSLRVRELKNENFILNARKIRVDLYDHVISACRQAGFSPRIVQEAVEVQTIVRLVAEGLGVAFLPSSVQNYGIKGVFYRPVTNFKLNMNAFLVLRKDNHSSLTRSFVEWFMNRVPSERKTTEIYSK
jgi:DNA-binding transcriptional LysR family regulator